MSNRLIPIALRAHARLIEKRKKDSGDRKVASSSRDVGVPSFWYDDWSELVLTYQIKTVGKPAGVGQKLQFGVYQVRFQDDLIGEGLFYPEDLSDLERGAFYEYAHVHKSGSNISLPLDLLKQDDFIYLLMYVGHTKRGMIVGHNLPLSISLLAHGVDKIKRGFYAGGFSYYFKTYLDAKKKRKVDLYKPRINIKSINPRSNFIVFRNPVLREVRRGNGCFIDLHTLAYVFTNKDYNLTEAAEVFGVAFQAAESDEHMDGPVSLQSIDALRAEVQASWELYKKLIEESRKHPVPTPPNKWYSPGSLGKAYLRAMNVHVPTLQSEGVGYSPNDIHGLAMASYYGGRAEIYLRNVTAPVALTDFRSMYPTIAVLMHLWEMITAKSVHVEDATEEIITWLKQVSLDDLFHQEAWGRLRVLACIVPDGDFLPVRGQFSQSYQSLGWGYLYQKDKAAPREMWYALSDIIASKLNTGKLPKIIKALRFVPDGRRENMRSVKFRGSIVIDPYHDDFFKLLVEGREIAKKDKRFSGIDRERLDDELKSIANSTAYGLTIELNPSETLIDVDVQAFSDHAFRAIATRFEQPGGFYFPIIGTLITAGAHLMLALGISEVEAVGGLPAFDDTDSIAMIASRGQERSHTFTDHHGTEMIIPVMSFENVKKVIAKFEALNPYDHKIVPGSILRLEPENDPTKDLSFYDPQNKLFLDEQATPGDTGADLYYYGVASKRYALFNKRGDYTALRWRSEAALGQWINPASGDEDETWIDLAWHIGMNGRHFMDTPIFEDVPIMSKVAVTTAGDMQAIETYNHKAVKGDYQKGVKPFEIMLHPLTDRWLMPKKGSRDYKPALLVAPNASDLQNAMELDYTNLYDPGKLWKPTFLPMIGFHDAVGEFTNLHQVTRFSDYLYAYFRHRDTRLDDAYGEPCEAETIGFLYHPQIVIDRVDYVGKEMPNPDRLDADIQDDESEVNIFTPDIFESEILPTILQAGATKTALASGIPAMTVTRYLKGERPSAVNRARLKKAMPKLDEEYDIYHAEVLPRLLATPTRQVVELTGLSFRYIQYLKNGAENPGGEALKKLIVACNMPKDGEEWKDNLLPRLLEIPTSEIIRLTGFSRRYVFYLKNGERQNPSGKAIEKLRVAIYKYERKNKR